MTKRGFRSVVSVQKRTAEEIVGANVFRDRRIDETVNTLNPETIRTLVIQALGECLPNVANSYTQAEVRTDSLGRGTLQYPEKLEAKNSTEIKGWDSRRYGEK